MPYKDKEQQKEYWKDRKRQQRMSTPDNVHPELSTPEVVPASYVEGLSGRMYEFLPERPRYLTLSDGQVLDRANQPSPSSVSGVMIQSMRQSNESFNYHPNTGVLSASLRARLS